MFNPAKRRASATWLKSSPGQHNYAATMVAAFFSEEEFGFRVHFFCILHYETQKSWVLANSSHSVALWGSDSIISAFHSAKCRKNGNFYCPECCRTNTRIVANFLHFFANWFAFFLHVFCILILAIKMDLHFLHYFCIFVAS